MPALAQDAGTRGSVGAEQVVITSTRASDREVTKKVETALRSNPYVDDSHITVSVRDGVVTLEGIVVDTSDLRDAVLISSRVAGVKRVVDDLELHRLGDD